MTPQPRLPPVNATRANGRRREWRHLPDRSQGGYAHRWNGVRGVWPTGLAPPRLNSGQVQRRRRLQRLRSTESRHGGPVCCNGWPSCTGGAIHFDMGMQSSEMPLGDR